MFFPLEARGLEKADAAVPAEDGIVVAGGTKFFGFAEALEGAFEEREKRVGRLTAAELRFGAPLLQKSFVVELFVAVGEPRK